MKFLIQIVDDMKLHTIPGLDQVEAQLGVKNEKIQRQQQDQREGERPGENIEQGNRGIVERALDDKTGYPQRGISPDFS